MKTNKFHNFQMTSNTTVLTQYTRNQTKGQTRVYLPIKKVFGFVISLMFLQVMFTGCEYIPKEENFIDLKKPANNHQLELSLVPANDTIKIFKNTKLTFMFNPNGLALSHATIAIDSIDFSINSDTSTITINPEFYTTGIHRLKAKYYSNSGTGSIADKLGAEGYMIEKNYVLLIDGSKAQAITAQYSINSNRMLELSWPECTNLNFDAYIIKNGYQVIKVITDRKSSRFVDSLYVGGKAYYSVDTRVVTNNKITTGNQLTINEDYPHLNFKQIRADSLMIYWNRSKLKCNVHLAYGVGQSEYVKYDFSSDTDTCCVIASPPFGEQFIFQISTQPFYKKSYFVFETFEQKYYTYGTALNESTNNLGYNGLKNILFAGNYSNLNCYDMTSKTKIRSVNLSEYPTLISNAVNSSKLAVYTYQNIYVYPDETLSNPVKISLSGINSIKHFMLTDNNYIAMEYYDSFIMINLANNNEISTLNLTETPYYTPYPKITTSQDGKYICITTNTNCKIYRFENKQYVQILSNSRNYNSARFNPLNPSELVLTFSDSKVIEVRSIPDFSLLKTIQLPGFYHIENFDTKTGLLLLNNFSKLLIVDIHTGKIQTGPNCTSDKFSLYGNNIFSSNGRYIDISQW